MLLSDDDAIDEDGKRTIIFRALERGDTSPGFYLRKALERFACRHPTNSTTTPVSNGVVEEQKLCAQAVGEGLVVAKEMAKDVEAKDWEMSGSATTTTTTITPISTSANTEGEATVSSGEEGPHSCVEDVKSIVHHLIMLVLDFYPELKSSEGISLTIAAVERVVFQHLYHTVFAEVEMTVAEDIKRLEDQYQAEALRAVATPLSPSQRCMSPNEQNVVEAIESLALISKSRTGYDKLRCLVTTCERLAENKHINADELLPRFARALLQSRTPKLPAELVFIEHFCDRQMLLGVEGYALTTIQAALTMVLLGHHGFSP